MEDALVLSSLLGRVRDTEEMPSSLRAYDAVRKSRVLKSVDESYEATLLIFGLGSDAGRRRLLEVVKELQGAVEKVDLERTRMEASRIMDEMLR